MDVVAQLRAAVGDAGLVTDPALLRGHLTDWRGAFRGSAACVVRPAGTAEVAEVVRICRDAHVAVVPQGGNTGLCGGAVPDDSGRQVVLALTRMRRVRRLDPVNHTVTVEAGTVLADVQAAARDAGLLFPLSLVHRQGRFGTFLGGPDARWRRWRKAQIQPGMRASRRLASERLDPPTNAPTSLDGAPGAEGSCTIGGNLSTNAGGNAVLRYGTMRDLTLGLEVVLPDGQVWDGLRALRKDNTGYDLKHLFIGAEGTLGVITAAVLRLFPAVRARATAWVALPTVAAALDLIGVVRARSGDRLTAFELMSRQAVAMVGDDPLPAPHPWYALVELTDTVPAANLDEVLATALADADVADAVIAAGPAQAGALWAVREGISEAQNHAGPSLKHDVTVPIGDLPAFVARAGAALRAVLPGVRLVTYGHVGDGNLHYNLSKPVGVDDVAFLARADELARIVYDEVAGLGGSISAEHGLGQARNETAARYKSSVELSLMRGLKQLLDPSELMNPGKVLPIRHTR